MAQTSYIPSQTAKPITVVSSNFLAPNPIDLVIIKKIMTLANGTFEVSDVKGNVVFNVKAKVMSLHDHRVLLDAAGNPILSFQKKLSSGHGRWVVFRGDSSDSQNILFSVKHTSFMQLKTSLDVFLARNKEENVCDFIVKGNWLDRSCTIYAGNGTSIIAQMHMINTVKHALLGKDTIGLKVNPNVDYAFIVALVVIVHEINTPFS